MYLLNIYIIVKYYIEIGKNMFFSNVNLNKINFEKKKTISSTPVEEP